jgi:hypothetical protein
LERRSDKHSPRVDDELRHEVEPHVEEFRNAKAVWQALGGHNERRR